MIEERDGDHDGIRTCGRCCQWCGPRARRWTRRRWWSSYPSRMIPSSSPRGRRISRTCRERSWLPLPLSRPRPFPLSSLKQPPFPPRIHAFPASLNPVLFLLQKMRRSGGFRCRKVALNAGARGVPGGSRGGEGQRWRSGARKTVPEAEEDDSR